MGQMTVNQGADRSLSPVDYARLVGRSRRKMPTVLGKLASHCSASDLRKLKAFNRELARIFGRLEQSACTAIDFRLSPNEKAILDRHDELQWALWRWALGVQTKAPRPSTLAGSCGSP
jgi:hypothetical protein